MLKNEGFDWKTEAEKSLYKETLRILSTVTKPRGKKNDGEKELTQASKDLKAILSLADFDAEVLRVLMKDNNYKPEKVAATLHEKLVYQLNSRWEIYEEKVQAAITRFAFLRAIDVLWTEHLVTLDNLQDSVKLSGYSQKEPLTKFKEDGMNLFVALLQEIDKEIGRTIFKINPDLVPAGILEDSK